MTQDQIKTSCEAHYKTIREAENKIKELRELCTHPTLYKGVYSYKAGSFVNALICSDCGEFVKNLDQPKNETE